MVQFNFSQKKAIYKIIYAGIANSGKTANLKSIYSKLAKTNKVKLSTISASPKDNLFVDFLTIDIGIVEGMNTQFNIFSIPTGKMYHTIRKLFLHDVDGIVFVSDSFEIDENLKELRELELLTNKGDKKFKEIPLIIQWNKRDLQQALDIKILHEKINIFNAPEYTAIATSGEGVLHTVEKISNMIITKHINRKALAQDKEYTGQNTVYLPILHESNGQNTLKKSPKFGANIEKTKVCIQIDSTSKESEKIQKSQQDFFIDVHRTEINSEEVVTLDISGSINPSTGPLIKEKVSEQYIDGNLPVILNLGKVNYIHTTGFGLLIEIGNRARIMGGKIHLLNIPKQFQTTFELMGITKTMEVLDSKEKILDIFDQTPIDEIYEIDQEEEDDKPEKLIFRETSSITQKIKIKKFQSEFSHNVFISYDNFDVSLAKKLEANLQDEGYVIWRDRNRDDTSIKNKEERKYLIKNSHVIVLLWTKLAEKSKLVQYEWINARALGKNIIPCIFQDAPPLPLALKKSYSIDFKSYTQGLKELVDVVLAKKQIKYDYSILPPFSYIPFKTIDYFRFSEQGMMNLYSRLLESGQIIITQSRNSRVFCFGKTRMAIEFAYRFSFAFPDGVLWFNASSNWHREIQSLAYELGITNTSPNFCLSRDSINKFLQYIQSRPNMLLIIDNIDDLTILKKEIAPGFILDELECFRLYTTNSEEIDEKLPIFYVNNLSLEKAKQVINRIVPQKDLKGLKESKKIGTISGGNPLLLKFIAQYLLVNTKFSSQEYLNYIYDQFISQCRKISNGNYIFNIIIEKQLELIENENSMKILKIIALLPKKIKISYEILSLFFGILPNSKQFFSIILPSIKELANLSFIEQIGHGNVCIFSIVHDCLREYYKKITNVDNFVENAVNNFLNCYQNFACLEQYYEKSGYISMMDSLEIAINLAGQRPELIRVKEYLMNAGKTLQNQSFMPHYFIQQLYSTIFESIEVQNGLYKILQSSLPKVTWQKGGLWLKRCNKIFGKLLNNLHKNSELVSVDFRHDMLNAVIANCSKVMLLDCENSRKINEVFSPSSGNQIALFSPNEKDYVYIANHNKIQRWDIKNKIYSKTMLEHTDLLLAMDISSKNIIAAAGKDTSIYLVDVFSNKETCLLEGHLDSIHTLCFSKDGLRLLSGGSDSFVCLWDLTNYDLEYSIRSHSDTITALCFSPQEELFVSGARDGSIKVWKTNSGIPVATLFGHNGKITSLAFSPKAEYIASTGTDNFLKIWEGSTGKLLQTFVAHNSLIKCKFSQDGNYLWVCDSCAKLYKFRVIKINAMII